MPKFSIKTTRTIMENKEIEITFPLFLKCDGTYDSDNYEECVTLIKVNEDFSTIEISKSKFFGYPAEYTIKEFKTYRIDQLSTYLDGTNSIYSYGNDSFEFDALFNEIKKVMGL